MDSCNIDVLRISWSFLYSFIKKKKKSRVAQGYRCSGNKKNNMI